MLAAFNSDGLRTLEKTIDAPNLKDKTWCYPCYIEKWLCFVSWDFSPKNKPFKSMKKNKLSGNDSAGAISKLQIKKKVKAISPFSNRLYKRIKDGKKRKFVIDMFDKYCPETDVITMARTTVYTASMAIRMMADGVYTHKGISP